MVPGFVQRLFLDKRRSDWIWDCLLDPPTSVSPRGPSVPSVPMSLEYKMACSDALILPTPPPFVQSSGFFITKIMATAQLLSHTHTVSPLAKCTSDASYNAMHNEGPGYFAFARIKGEVCLVQGTPTVSFMRHHCGSCCCSQCHALHRPRH